jgi:hypothetical protein
MSSNLLCRRFLAERDGTNCHYCGQNFSVEELTVDHKTPLMRGGEDIPSNVVLACITCNSQKGPMTEQEFRTYGPIGGKFLILLEHGHYKPIPADATWPKGRYGQIKPRVRPLPHDGTIAIPDNWREVGWTEADVERTIRENALKKSQ